MKYRSNIAAALLSASTVALSAPAFAQTAEPEEIIVTGIRSSLQSALLEQRNSENLIEVIQAEDIGKLPDQNLAEVLENITGIQITRTAGVGTGVQIRGTNANRIEINGVSTVGSGAGRSGINFEDVNAAIISSVEVTKASEAKTIEGSVGGTVNLRTIRPLKLKKTLANIRIQGEDSSLSDEDISPRISGAYGDRWDTGAGEIGFVISGSYTEQESVSFRPRTDRDNVASPPGANPAEFLGIQFLVQEQENFDYETTNLAATVEWAPSAELKFYADAILNEQERSQDSYRLQASGISSFRQSSIPTQFETVDFGVGPGEFPAALVGTLVRRTENDDNGNLRFSSDTSSRVTDSQVLSVGGEWERDNWFAKAEFASTSADTVNPNLSTTLNFLNPNGNFVSRVTSRVVDADGNPLDENGVRTSISGEDQDRFNTNVGLPDNIDTTSSQAMINAALADAIASRPTTNGTVFFENSGFIFNDNSTPFAYDLRGDSLAFGIDQSSDYAPTREQLLDPNNVVLDQVDVGRSTTENQEDAFRLDFSYDLEDSNFLNNALTSIDFGYRWNQSSSKFDDIDDRIGGFSDLEDSPNGSLFAELLVPGPSNYGDADGRSLFISDFLLIDPDRAFNDQAGVLATLEGALAANRVINPGANGDLTANPQSDINAFYEVEENTNALYAQANFEYDMFRGNVGLRYVDTTVDSTAFGAAAPGQQRQLETTSSSYDFLLPRFNLAVTPREDIVLRAAYGSDIRRPDFSDVNTAFSLTQAENSAISLGNPGLLPEQVDSFDVSAAWYPAPASILSIGYFRKTRTDIFGNDFDGAALVPDVLDANGIGGTTDLVRETGPNCTSGIFNPIVIPNVLGDPTTTGLCVDASRPGNDNAETTQSGIEMAAQYDLSAFEDTLGWASGFGAIANYTIQSFSGGSVIDRTSGRGLTVLGDVSIPRGLLDFSENAYNITAFYEKYGLSARARYTWREGFRTQDFGGGANTSGSSTFSFPVHTLDRGQLNASINYDVNENFNVGIEAVNITEERIIQKCVSETGPTCFVGYPDRRIVFGGSYTF